MRVPCKQRKETANMKSRINEPRGGLRAVAGAGRAADHSAGAGKHAAMQQRVLPLAGVLIEVRDAFQGLCVKTGLQVLSALMEEDRTELCGPKGVPDGSRRAVRGGKTPTSIVLGGQRVAIQRPRARDLVRGELELPTFAWASDTDALHDAALAAVAAGVSTRRYARLQPELPEQVRPPEPATSSSAVSRRFVSMSAEQLKSWLSASLAELDLPVVMIDGIHLADSVILVALGIDDKGNKHVLGLREGSTESARVVKALLSDLVERGLAADRARLWVIDGGKALRRGITEVFGRLALVQRCQEHKRRNVLEHLPEAKQAGVGKALRDAWDSANERLAAKQLQRLAGSLEAEHPGAAASLREGLAETLTVQGLGITGALYRTLRTTNPIENLNGSIARYTRNVKRWKDASMALRWTASALSDAQPRFRKLRGHRDMKALLAALEAHAQKLAPSPPSEEHQLAA
jgi:putative transposase